MRYLFALLLAILGSLLAPSSASAVNWAYSYVGQSAYTETRPEAPATAWLKIQNTGTYTWYKNGLNGTAQFRLGTKNPQDRSSLFSAAGSAGHWISANRIEMEETSVPPGGIATFTFTIKPSDAALGTYHEYFAPVAEGVTWLPDIGIYWDWTRPGYRVTSIVDGDTFNITYGGVPNTQVRTAGVDTPEITTTPHQCYADEATTFTSNRINGKVVELANDPLQTDRDPYNRLIRFVYLAGLDTGRELVDLGYAHNWTGTHSKQAEYAAAQTVADQNNVGGWGACGW